MNCACERIFVAMVRLVLYKFYRSESTLLVTRSLDRVTVLESFAKHCFHLVAGYRHADATGCNVGSTMKVFLSER